MTENIFAATMVTGKGLAESAAFLADRDEDLACIFKTDGVPPLWERKPGFSTLVHIVLEQQVSLASALAMYRRLADHMVPFTPGRFLDAGSSHLRSMGVTRQKASYCINVAEALVAGRLDLKAISGMDDRAVFDALTRIKGIGPWTAGIYLLMALRRPDVWPSGDIALTKTVQKIKRLPGRPSQSTLWRIAEAWRPFRSVAARMLWHHYLSNKG